MFRPQLRQLSLRCERVKFGLSTPARQFSYTPSVAEEQPQPSANRNPNPNPRPSPGPNRRPHNPNGPRSTPNNSRPPRVIDARSFAASKAGGGEQAKIIRSPRSRNVRPGGPPPKRTGKPSAKGGKPKGKGKRNVQRGSKSAEDTAGENAQAALIEQIQQDQILQARPTAVRYEPTEIDLSSLRNTWPQIPTDANAHSASVYQELSRRSGRIAGGHLAISDLGRRLQRQQNVVFHSESEKAEALEEANRLSRHIANQASQRRGELCEAQEVQFRQTGAESPRIQAIMKSRVTGQYPATQSKSDIDPALNQLQEKLRNNRTYTGQSGKFLDEMKRLMQ
ncbi:unnamed protein product [Penicillium salamii]|uniref:Uncharacterized protein n=1 Tax=Penicillium salamii TaxID=1612424 RepID=A0A9W4JPK5_9EURO|nr:unnamed protein product [Penicillium salamii]CAG8236641.1 unnamed protein product [Penicillium salamii]CAG8366158.1 unnamed protein product [Penicillium salamii]CAG8366794.1 unnamed protein product [Penicillium salamii]CAG8382906.1 unnamed protein product [Penicillium salamii]